MIHRRKEHESAPILNHSIRKSTLRIQARAIQASSVAYCAVAVGPISTSSNNSREHYKLLHLYGTSRFCDRMNLVQQGQSPAPNPPVSSQPATARETPRCGCVLHRLGTCLAYYSGVAELCGCFPRRHNQSLFRVFRERSSLYFTPGLPHIRIEHALSFFNPTLSNSPSFKTQSVQASAISYTLRNV